MGENQKMGLHNEDTRINLLLVDDEARFRENIARLLENRGFITRQADNGETCLASLQERPVDVVVLDVNMPGMHGIEVLRQIRKRYPEIEVILLTGQASAKDGVEGIKSGAFDYLYKPIEIEHLSGKIRQAHEKIRLRERHRKEARFRASVEQKMAATERLASLGTLATGVAHEINNPLALIKQSVKLMRLVLSRKTHSDLKDRAEFERILKNIEDGTNRIRQITHQMLGYVGKNNSAPAQVDLNDLVQDVVSIVQGIVKEKNIEIVPQMGPDIQHVGSDPYKLRQVLVNLLVNAIHATDDGGAITITADADEKEFTLAIKDTGEGISKNNMDKIFDPFFTTKGPGKGTGLGLFLTRSIVEAMGGEITVTSQRGHGSVFSIRLPNDKDPVAPDVENPGMTPGEQPEP